MKPGYDKFEFTFPDENGKKVSLSDAKYKDKPLIIQIMGTWCPNCMDETKFLSDWYNSSKRKDIEVIALTYERFSDTAIVNNNIRRLKKNFDIKYPILFAGPSDKKEAAKTLPMLNRVFAFPTTIFLNKDKRVVKIHTGFNGPATGVEYHLFIDWFNSVTGQLQ
jgi:thiol-disulfide isomerase/thioredoxin